MKTDLRELSKRHGFSDSLGFDSPLVQMLAALRRIESYSLAIRHERRTGFPGQADLDALLENADLLCVEVERLRVSATIFKQLAREGAAPTATDAAASSANSGARPSRDDIGGEALREAGAPPVKPSGFAALLAAHDRHAAEMFNDLGEGGGA